MFCHYFICHSKCVTVSGSFTSLPLPILQLGNAERGDVIGSYYHVGANYKEILLLIGLTDSFPRFLPEYAPIDEDSKVIIQYIVFSKLARQALVHEFWKNKVKLSVIGEDSIAIIFVNLKYFADF